MQHFDADGTWSSNPGPVELDLQSDAVHEIGNLLRLGRSEDHPGAIMHPYFELGVCKKTGKPNKPRKPRKN
jgi:hypothetical protein